MLFVLVDCVQDASSYTAHCSEAISGPRRMTRPMLCVQLGWPRVYRPRPHAVNMAEDYDQACRVRGHPIGCWVPCLRHSTVDVGHGISAGGRMRDSRIDMPHGMAFHGIDCVPDGRVYGTRHSRCLGRCDFPTMHDECAGRQKKEHQGRYPNGLLVAWRLDWLPAPWRPPHDGTGAPIHVAERPKRTTLGPPACFRDTLWI